MGKKALKSVGRPKDLDKKAAILQAAKAHFMGDGFDGASMDVIAETAGVSKLTIYNHFGNKEELFKAVILAKCEEVQLNDNYEQLAALSVEDALTEIGARFTTLMFQQDVQDMHRIVIAESADKPKIAQLVYEAGPAPTKAKLSQYLAMQIEAGWLDIDDIDGAVDMFFSILKGERFFTVMFNIEKTPSKKEIAGHVDMCVTIFLRAYGA